MTPSEALVVCKYFHKMSALAGQPNAFIEDALDMERMPQGASLYKLSPADIEALRAKGISLSVLISGQLLEISEAGEEFLPLGVHSEVIPMQETSEYAKPIYNVKVTRTAIEDEDRRELLDQAVKEGKVLIDVQKLLNIAKQYTVGGAQLN